MSFCCFTFCEQLSEPDYLRNRYHETTTMGHNAGRAETSLVRSKGGSRTHFCRGPIRKVASPWASMTSEIGTRYRWTLTQRRLSFSHEVSDWPPVESIHNLKEITRAEEKIKFAPVVPEKKLSIAGDTDFWRVRHRCSKSWNYPQTDELTSRQTDMKTCVPSAILVFDSSVFVNPEWRYRPLKNGV